jgi:hypothetical protein
MSAKCFEFLYSYSDNSIIVLRISILHNVPIFLFLLLDELDLSNRRYDLCGMCIDY